MQPNTHPGTLTGGYPDPALNRLSTFFRIFAAIPILILIGTVSGAGGSGWSMDGHSAAWAGGAGGLLFAGPLLMLLFRRKYPRWWFDWNLQLQNFGVRVAA